MSPKSYPKPPPSSATAASLNDGALGVKSELLLFISAVLVVAVYLDHGATAPMSAVALAAYVAAAEQVGNASSLHAPGRRARQIVEDARESIAAALGAHPSEVVFTHGGTEANNLAIKGTFWGRQPKKRVLLSAIEHHSVLEPAQWLRDYQGAQTEMIAVDKYGIVDLTALAELIDDDVALISVMLANNEIGVIEPISEVVAIAKKYQIPVHTDAIAAASQIPVNFDELGVDLLSVAGHKLGGPVSSGALLVKRTTPIQGLIQGGGQERNLRAGTLDVPAIAAFAAAVTVAVAELGAQATRLATLRDHLVQGILATIPDVILQGPPITPDSACADVGNSTPAGVQAASPGRLPGNALLTFSGTNADTLLFLLDQAGIAASAGAACSAGVAEPSHVLLACGVSPEQARGALRLSLGPTTTQAEIDRVVEVLPNLVAQARKVG